MAERPPEAEDTRRLGQARFSVGLFPMEAWLPSCRWAPVIGPLPVPTGRPFCLLPGGMKRGLGTR